MSCFCQEFDNAIENYVIEQFFNSEIARKCVSDIREAKENFRQYYRQSAYFYIEGLVAKMGLHSFAHELTKVPEVVNFFAAKNVEKDTVLFRQIGGEKMTWEMLLGLMTANMAYAEESVPYQEVQEHVSNKIMRQLMTGVSWPLRNGNA